VATPTITYQGSRIRRSKTYVVGTTRADTFDLGDVADWTEDGLRELALAVVLEENARQVRLDNPPSEVRVDGSLNKPLDRMRSNVSVQYGAIDARPAMRKLRANVQALTPAGLGVRWEWIAPRNESGRRLERDIAAGGPVLMTLFDRLFLVPRPANREAGVPYANIQSMSAPWKQGGRGFIGIAARSSRSAVRPGFSVIARPSDTRARDVGRRVGRGNRISRRTGEPVYFAGIWFFQLRRSLR